MNAEAVPQLLAVIRDLRALVAKPENDFAWSSWRDTKDALAELDRRLAELERGEVRHSALHMLFVPTGPAQELASSSGWGDEFCTIADRYDDAIAAVDP